MSDPRDMCEQELYEEVVSLRAELAVSESARAAHVITKRRRGGGREEVAHYMVGPRRETEEEAAEDLDRYVGSFGRERALQGEVAALRGAIDWALGAAPGPDGKWFGERPEGAPDFWWRRKLDALASNAGRKEAEVIRAALEARSLGGMTDRLVAAVDSLLAARGGEG